MPEDGRRLVSPKGLPHLRARRLLRSVARAPRHQALSHNSASDHRRLRSARGLGLVLCRQGDVRSLRSQDAPQRPDPAILLSEEVIPRRLDGWPRPLSLVQPGAALTEELAALGCELEIRSGVALRRLHVTLEEKPVQVAFVIAGELGWVAFPDFAEQRDLRIGQIVGHSVASGSAPGDHSLNCSWWQ